MEIKIYFTKYCKYCCSSQQPLVNFRIEIHANFDPRYIGNRSFCAYYTGLLSNVRCAPLTCEGAWPSSISCYAVPFFVGSTRRILRSGTLHNKALLLAYICLELILDRTSCLTARSDRNSISVCLAIRGFQVPEYVRTVQQGMNVCYSSTVFKYPRTFSDLGAFLHTTLPIKIMMPYVDILPILLFHHCYLRNYYLHHMLKTC